MILRAAARRNPRGILLSSVGMEEMSYRPPRQPLAPQGGIDHHTRDMTVTVSSDLPLSAVQARLKEQEQWLPIDGDANQSIGTLVSCDSTGPLRLGYGAWRDLLLGAQFINGRDELITVGGRTVKNVAGYDLTKFMVGQRSVFGRLVTVTSRTYRRPLAALLARHAPDVQILNRLIPTPIRPHWAMLTSDALLCGYLGDEPAIAFYRASVPRSEPKGLSERMLDEDIEHRSRLWNPAGTTVFRASVPPARLPEFVARIGGTSWIADAAFGIVLGSIEEGQETAAIRETTSGVGGTVRFYRGAYGPALELSTTPQEQRIIERLKRAFDPDAKLNPLPWRTS